MDQLNKHISKNKEQYLSELFDLLRIPSVSADPAYKKDVEKTAQGKRKQKKFFHYRWNRKEIRIATENAIRESKIERYDVLPEFLSEPKK